jgi:arginine repressor
MTKRQATRAGQLLTANQHLGQRDMRDLLMEHGIDGVTATRLCEGRA